VVQLKEILGALIFGAERPLTVKEMRQCLAEVADLEGGETVAFGDIAERDVAAGVAELGADLTRSGCGFSLTEVAGGIRLQSNPLCGKWLRHLLKCGKPNRLSQPALETLAVVAYRQPVTRSAIEAVRGVTVDHVLRMLLEMQLLRIAGRSDLPGRPFLYATTQLFLEHFGLKSLKDLSDIGPAALGRLETAAPPPAPAGPSAGDAAAGPDAEAVARDGVEAGADAHGTPAAQEGH
jgi:segregation and condensation protein B